MAEENLLQVPYEPASQAGSSSDVMVPRDLHGPIMYALNRLKDRVGDIDEFVAGNLAWETAEMGQYLSREQVDAVALSIDKFQQGRGLILGDETGIGKGRVAGAMMRFAFMNGYTPIFLTATADLFSDIYRDLRSINSENLFHPFVLNAGSPIRNMDGTIAVRATSKQDIDMALESEHLPIGYNAVLATYSQFNRKVTSSPKGSFLRNIAVDNIIITDEAHKAAGDSNTGDNVIRAIAQAAGVNYSSATFSKGAQNMTLYNRAFPRSYGVGAVSELMRMGGEPVMEVIAATLAKDGAMVRREHDSGTLDIETVFDEELLGYWEGVADQYALILQDVATLDKRIKSSQKDAFMTHKERLEEKGEDVSKLRMESGLNFGSRIYQMLRQFATVSKADFAAKQAIAELDAGRKPAVMIEQTFESALNNALVLGADPNNLSFRDLLNSALHKVTHVKRTDPQTGQTIEMVVEFEGVADQIEQAKERINNFPDLMLSPIDHIINRIEEAGYSVAELSGRKIKLANDPETGRPRLAKRKGENTTKIVHQFNAGDFDAMVFTKSACAGLSMHADAEFEDKRQRTLLELEIFQDVFDRKQGWGRFNRKGQVTPPRIKTISNGLPSEHRILSMQERKLKGMQSTTTSNSESNMGLENVIDILNTVGDEVCQDYLANNPDIVVFFEDMGIDVAVASKEDENRRPPLYYVNKLTGYLCLLSVADQRAIYDDLSQMYQQKIDELNAQGINPLSTHKLDIKAKSVEKELLMGEEDGYDSVFDEPLYLEKLTYKEEVRPLPAPVIEGIAKRNLERLNDWLKPEEDSNALVRYTEIMSEKRMETLSMFVSAKYPEVTMALQAAFDEQKDNSVSKADRKLEEAADFLRKISRKWRGNGKADYSRPVIGEAVDYRLHNGEEWIYSSGILANIVLPEESQIHCLGEYKFTIIPRDGGKPIEKSLHAIMSQKFDFSITRDQDHVWDAIKANKPGEVERTVYAMTGNVCAAAEIALLNRLGSCANITLEDGQTIRAIKVKKGYENQVRKGNYPIKLSNYQETIALMNKHDSLKLTVGVLSALSKQPYLAKYKGKEGVILHTPNKRIAKSILDDTLIDMLGEKDKARNGKVRSIHFPPENMSAAIERIMELTVISAEPVYRDEIMQIRNQYNINIRHKLLAS